MPPILPDRFPFFNVVALADWRKMNDVWVMRITTVFNRTISTLLLTALTVVAFAAGEQEDRTPVAASGATTPRGTVVFLEGSVEIDGQTAELGTEMGNRAVVQTGPNSYCDIVFADKNAVRVAQNATVTLDFSGKIIEVNLEKGGVTAVLRKLNTVAGQDSFRVSSPSAVAGVRGTSFCVWSDGVESYICACNGTVHTIDAQGSNESVLSSAHHSALLYSPAGQSYSAAAAAMLHHTDADVESLAARIGETIDWTTAD